jgi:hypothetical protein
MSDIHLNFLEEDEVRRFLEGLSSKGANAWLVSGDIGEADSVGEYLRLFAELVPGMTYFTAPGFHF